MCSFDITLNESADAFVNKARTAVTNAGGTFDGDSSSGTFRVPVLIAHVGGDYTINGSIATINITEQPFGISCSAIENYIKGHV